MRTNNHIYGHWTIVLFILFVWFPVKSTAQTKSYELIVEKTDGTERTFVVTDKVPYVYEVKEDGVKSIAISDNRAMYYIPCSEVKRLFARATLPVSIEISSAMQVTYCSNYNLDFTDKPELKAYVATGYDKDAGTIWLTRVKQVPANTGFLLMGDAGTYEIPTVTGCTYYKNLFKGTIDSETIYTTDGDYTNYYLSNGDYGVGFYKVGSSVDLKANRAYLAIPTDMPTQGREGETETIKVSKALQVPYYTSECLDFTSMEAQGMKAYTATGYNYETGTIWLTRVKKVPGHTGVLVIADKSGEYNVPTALVTSVYANMFNGAENAQKIYPTSYGYVDGVYFDYVNYYLSDGSYGIGFYKAKEEGVELAENRCFLQIPVRTSSGARGKSATRIPDWSDMIISDDVIELPLFSDNTTGISEVQFRDAEEDVYYNLQGQRVVHPGKGIYIRNDKKVIVK